jgi:hypothetical protein
MVVQKKGYMYAMIYVLGNTGALPLAQCPRGGFRPGARALARLAKVPRTRARSSLACGLLAPGDKAL